MPEQVKTEAGQEDKDKAAPSEAPKDRHPNPVSEADRCAYAVWSTLLLSYEAWYMVSHDDAATKQQQHIAFWYAFHAAIAAYVCVCTFEEEHLDRCSMLNRLIWPCMEALKKRATGRCPWCKTPWRLGVLSFYIGNVISLDRVSKPMSEEAGWIWLSIFVLSSLRFLMDILVSLYYACCRLRSREKTD